MSTQLFYWEGRLDEIRRLRQEAWNTSSDKAGDLRSLWLIDSSVLTMEQVRASVEQAAAKAPDDDRVWLARAHLALLSGQFAEAARWLDSCRKRRPEDPVVWRAWLRWARAADSIDEARGPSRTCQPNGFRSPRCWLSVRGSPIAKVTPIKSGPRSSS